jgi:hypothetical protein
MVNDMLFMDAANRMPWLGPCYVPFKRLWHGS